MTDQLPVPISRKRAIVKKRTPPQIVVPMLIADAGEQASWRYVEFFTANTRNPNTRRAYARACGSFLTWCEERGLTLTPVHPRRRGERRLGAIRPPFRAGSSPQARGTRFSNGRAGSRRIAVRLAERGRGCGPCW